MSRLAIFGSVVALAMAGVCLVVVKSGTAPTIDGSSDAAFKASLDVVKGSLHKEQYPAFETAMLAHAQAALMPQGADNVLSGLMALSADKDAPARRLRGRLDGLTAEQIMRTAARLPVMTEARQNSNESAAIATLKNIASAQEQCLASGIIDANRNGAGEYGYFAELSGGVPVRSNESGGTGTERISPPFLSGSFTNVQGSRVMRSGYFFQMYLPDSAAAAVSEAASGGSAGQSINAANAEVMWCVYAWPTSYGNSGKRTFFINQAGDVMSCRNSTQRYNGTTKVPAATAAMLETVASPTMASTLAANATGQDQERWLVVN